MKVTPINDLAFVGHGSVGYFNGTSPNPPLNVGSVIVADGNLTIGTASAGEPLPAHITPPAVQTGKG